jgi:16S rRNA (guanine966-N2)-methyltransferase
VRVIAGAARGRPLRATRGTRPTADLIKGVIFSMLEALAYKRGFEPDDDGNLAAAVAWPRVLDLFAGSGALGIESLSRGATHAVFVEADREAARAITSNLRSTGFDDRADLLIGHLQLTLPRVPGPIDLVFADPPYADASAISQTVESLGRSGLLAASSVVVLEQPSTAEPPAAIGQLPLANTRTHGRTRLSLYAAPEC